MGIQRLTKNAIPSINLEISDTPSLQTPSQNIDLLVYDFIDENNDE